MSSESLVWILGAENPNIDRSIPWDASDLPNLSDPDILIINLQSLNEVTLKHFHDDLLKRNELVEQIQSKLYSGGTIIFLTARIITLEAKSLGIGGLTSLAPEFSNYFLSPTTVWTHDVPEGRVIRYDSDNHPFRNFLQYVKKFKFYLEYGYPGTQYRFLEEYNVTDNSGNKLSFALEVNDGRNRGKVIFLPPSTQLSIEEAIGSILEIYGKTSPKEVPPTWVSNLSLPGLSDINNDILNFDEELKGLQEKIRIVETRKQTLLNHFRLLYAKDISLENAVYDAFKVLGIDNIIRGRASNLEDWVFEFKTLSDSDPKYAVIEVKGADRRTTQANITQSDKWVSEYFGEEEVLAKGVFVPNQYRLCKYPNSKNDRLHFEPNELKFAATRNVCIIPSCVLFECVNEALNGMPPMRDRIEKTILETKGLLTKL